MRFRIETFSRIMDRPRNEDDLVLILPDGTRRKRELPSEDSPVEEVAGERLFAAVLDGVGGAVRGDLGSKAAAEVLLETAQELPAEDVLSKADAAVTSLTGPDAGGNGLYAASTLAAVWIEGNEATVYTLGDSPVLLLRDGKASPLTSPHAVYRVTGLLRRPVKSAIYAFLGMGSAEETFAECACRQVTLQEDDALLLCSDGFTDLVSCTAHAAALQRNGLKKIAEEAAERKGFFKKDRDNMTAILIRAAETEERK